MSLEQKVGQVFMLGFEGRTLDASNRALIQGLDLGGVTLFGRNIESGPQLQQLNSALQTVADPVPLFISIDQEGGLVVRVTSGATSSIARQRPRPGCASQAGSTSSNLTVWSISGG